MEESSDSVLGHTDSSEEELDEKQQKKRVKSISKKQNKLRDLMKFTGEEWGKTSFVDPYPANLAMVASWAKDGAAKYKLLQNILAVHVIKKTEGYKEKKKEIYKR